MGGRGDAIILDLGNRVHEGDVKGRVIRPRGDGSSPRRRAMQTTQFLGEINPLVRILRMGLHDEALS